MTTIKRFLTLFLIASLSLSVWGAEITFTAGTDKGSTTSTSADNMTKGGITISSTSAGLAYAEYRFYSGTITISSTVGNMSSIVFTCTTTGYASVLGGGTASTGSISSSGSTATWSGSSASFTLQITAQSRVSSIVVTTSGGTTYTVTLNKNGSTSDITGCSGTYTLPTTGEHVADACTGWSWHCWANAPYSTGSPTTTAPSTTKITTMTAAGTAYAVYKHEEASGSPSNVTFNVGTDQGSRTSQ
ncbi:MAG: hypothetical protein II452_02805, partial [Paludibacteraceae bacterium]|nr:hypothetical protein [Paludibacteraceae bacterium]